MARHKPPLIAHVIYALSTGGLENGLVNIINRTPPERYRHVIICITGADDFAQRITAKNVQIIQLHKREGHDLRFYWRLWRVFRKLRPDIIHSRNLAALETQLLGLTSFGVRRVHGEHGREVNDLDGRNWKYLNFRKFMRAFIHRYIAVSQDLEQWLINTVGVPEGKVCQIYNGVDHQRFSPANVKQLAVFPAHWQGLDDILVVGTVGRLTPVKDQQLLLQAVAVLRDSHPKLYDRVRIIIVGGGPLKPELDQLLIELGLETTSWLPGDRDDVPALLAAMDVFVLPSLAEGVSNTVLEAMASGLPIVATAVGGNVELVEEGVNGSLFPSGNVAAFSEALVVLLENRAQREQMAANARQLACQNFDWQRTVESYMGVYDELLDG